MTNISPEKIEQIKQELLRLESEMNNPDIFNDRKKSEELAKKYAEIKKTHENIVQIQNIESQILECETIIKSDDEEMINMAQSEKERLEKILQKLDIETDEMINPSSPLDKKNAIMEIRAGTGGDESALFGADLFRMYSRYAEKNNLKIEIISESRTEIGGFKEIIFLIKGERPFGKLKYESGVHRVQRVPETEKAGRIHTSAATVAVLPEAEDVDIKIEEKDIRIDTFCSSGAGGQSVNTTYSAVRITHMASGLVVSCQDERSQTQNREKAMQILKSRLLAFEEEKRMRELSETRKSQVGTGDRSEKIRTYNYPQNRVTDHRINLTSHNLDRVLDGDIDEFILKLKEYYKNG
ncbi:MAG: peptide chain release factor 1 [Patescibacteria group bacterium]|nr:peptide chain release factor 1 [Patescibacteria group bacterium]MDD4304463.1 peptide chain release factor 1 [Patescibacteria group bacterium]MDD4694823.1 peptide chain release factor 1 [Patescibacteria group bacterium]